MRGVTVDGCLHGSNVPMMSLPSSSAFYRHHSGETSTDSIGKETGHYVLKNKGAFGICLHTWGLGLVVDRFDLVESSSEWVELVELVVLVQTR